MFCKKVFLEISQSSQENACARVSFLIKLKTCNFIKKETLAQVFSCEFCEISKNTFFHKTPLVTASMCTPSVILVFCFILAASNTVIWVSLFGAHSFKLEVKDFIFHAVVSSRETVQTLAWKFLLCISQKVLEVYIFPNFVLVWYIVVQKLVKTYPRHVYTFCLFLF